MILITGSTGHLGKAVIGNLLKNGIPAKSIAAFARNSDKAASLSQYGIEVRMGNYDDPDSMVRAFRGIDRLLFISGSELEKRGQQHRNLINAAVNSKVPYIVYTSFERKSDEADTPVSIITRTHIETERMIRESGLFFTFLRNAIYAEGIPYLLGEDLPVKGIYYPAGDGRVPFASRVNMAEATARILAGEGHENKSYSLVSPHNYSFYELASIISEITGRTVKYFCPNSEEYAETLRKSGVPEEAIKGSLVLAEGFRQGCFESEHSDLEALLGHKPTELKTILADFYK